MSPTSRIVVANTMYGIEKEVTVLEQVDEQKVGKRL